MPRAGRAVPRTSTDGCRQARSPRARESCDRRERTAQRCAYFTARRATASVSLVAAGNNGQRLDDHAANCAAGVLVAAHDERADVDRENRARLAQPARRRLRFAARTDPARSRPSSSRPRRRPRTPDDSAPPGAAGSAATVGSARPRGRPARTDCRLEHQSRAAMRSFEITPGGEICTATVRDSRARARSTSSSAASGENRIAATQIPDDGQRRHAGGEVHSRNSGRGSVRDRQRCSGSRGFAQPATPGSAQRPRSRCRP